MDQTAQAPALPAPTASEAAGSPEAAKLKLGPIQAASGAIFALFLVLHLLTASSGLLGPGAYDATLSALRKLYRPHVAVEIGIMGAAGSVHIACAILQMIRRRKLWSLAGSGYMRAHRLAGYFLLLVIPPHVLATRIAPTLASGPTATGKADFAFLAYASLSVPAFFWPYYLLLAIAGATHLGIGLHLASRILLRRRSTAAPAASRPTAGPSRARLALIVGFAAVVTAGVFSILWRGHEASRERFPEYKALADKLSP
jgi:succinate dehydrogenase/fumarate reductase cytochrome b subunit